MAELGRFNHLQVTRHTRAGAFLDGEQYGEILLPHRFTDPSMQPGTAVDVFLYRDSEDRVVATLLKPKAQVGECAYLKVVSSDEHGAFLDWGLPKDLLVPYAEQQARMKPGYSYTVYLFVDKKTGRIAASSRLERHLSSTPNDFVPRQPVGLLIYGRSDLGFKAVINDTHLGQLYDNETFTRLHYGERVQGYIKRVREDGKIDLTLQLPAHHMLDDLGEKILAYLEQQGGICHLTDKSSPDEIYRVFGVSKANYKKALGRLYRKHLIDLSKDRVKLA